VDVVVTLLAHDDRAALLALARRALHAAVRRAPAPGAEGVPVFDRRAGAFVTLWLADALRGCIGIVEPQRLGDTVVHCAGAAATNDPRFPRVVEPQVAAVRIEVSVLTPLAPLPDPAALEVGRHGLVVVEGHRRGLLLPQVATEWGWSREELLAQTCRKAGLPADAWRAGAQLFTFEAEIFGESHA
jgi:AmmeMemoRadiSam system protein A